jgi:hypothetical protein
MAKKKATTGVAQLPSNDVGYACFRLVGDDPGLLVHDFDQKSFEEMLAGMCDYKLPREPKDLEKDYQRAFCRNEKEVEAIPAAWIRAAMVSASPRSKGMVEATVLSSSVYVMGKSLPIRAPKGPIGAKAERTIETAESVNDVRIVRVGSWGNKKPDVRARPYYDQWSMDVVIRYYPDQIELRSVAWALDAAGKFVGLCEWRPAKRGEFGRFTVESLPETEYQRIIAESATPYKRLQVPPWLMTAATAVGKSPGQVIQEVHDSRRKKNGAKATPRFQPRPLSD